jgi:precorrin-2 dehydrogenase/sirohydrochlorin ferrochelatase
VLVTVSTGGHSPALASWLRDELADQVDDAVDTLAQLLSEARVELLAEGRRAAPTDWRTALDSGMLDLVRDGRLDEARELLRATLHPAAPPLSGSQP